MPLERHHKWIIGGVSSILVIFMISSGIMMYLLFVKQEVNYGQLNQKISDVQGDTQIKINQLTENIRQTNEILNTQLGSLSEELELLKASAGEDFSGIIESSIKSVVTIRTNAGYQGTGFIISDDGYLVTNAHVLADSKGYLATSIQAITYEQVTRDAEFIGYDGNLDVALLKVSGTYSSLDLGNSDGVQVGEKVIAIGNPLGLQFSVSQGIISAVHRPGPGRQEAYLQTDAALNPGNSGGPLINNQGKVMGINNFKIGSGENLGFALESNFIKGAVNEIAIDKINRTLV
jgi:S1-C subfamily serine protease